MITYAWRVSLFHTTTLTRRTLDNGSAGDPGARRAGKTAWGAFNLEHLYCQFIGSSHVHHNLVDLWMEISKEIELDKNIHMVLALVWSHSTFPVGIGQSYRKADPGTRSRCAGQPCNPSTTYNY